MESTEASCAVAFLFGQEIIPLVPSSDDEYDVYESRPYFLDQKIA